jgi:hypothetical protein
MKIPSRSSLVATVVVCLGMAPAIARAADLSVYDDGLEPGFEDWSWATHDLADASVVHSGSVAVSFQPDDWEALWFQHQGALSAVDYESCRFWIHGGSSGGQRIRFHLWSGGSPWVDVALEPYLPGGQLPAGSWVQVTIPMADLGATVGSFDGLLWQDDSGGDQGTVYIDDVVMVENTGPPPTGDAVAVTVIPFADRRPIDPRILGVNFGDFGPGVPAYPVRRWGGNSTTRYNWQADVHNTASDWFFMNIPSNHPDPSQLPSGSESDIFVGDVLASGGEPIITLPTIGWTPRTERVKQWSYSVSTYGAQDQTECSYFDTPPAWCQPDAGNGACSSVANTTGFCVDGEIVGNDPTETSLTITENFAGDWIDHLLGAFGPNAVRLYALDNEPMLWNSTHRDVHPTPATFDEVWQRGLDVAREIKLRDPEAEVLGPVVWGWCAFFTSASDAAGGASCVDGPDRQSHGGQPFLEWYLGQICAEEQSSGVRPVDYLDIHFYPQGGVSGLSDPGEDPATAARRLRSVKELHDPTYVSESWINEPVELIPRIRRWIDAACPGVGLAVTEYRWGSDSGPTGALAQIEVLALFGREGVDIATRWVAPDVGSLAEDAFRLFLDYDGSGSRIGGTSVAAESTDVDAVAGYAVHRDDDTLLVLLINKDLLAREAPVRIGVGVTDGARWIPFDSTSGLGSPSSIAVVDGVFTAQLQARSAALVEIPLPGGLIFADGFERGDRSTWDQ